jgi:hypothetical protein
MIKTHKENTYKLSSGEKSVWSGSGMYFRDLVTTGGSSSTSSEKEGFDYLSTLGYKGVQ